MTTTVWWTGPGDRVIYVQDWARLGITAAEVAWNSSNGWSVPQCVFTQPQLNVLDEIPNFLLDQDGPRTHPAPAPADVVEESGFYYYAQIKALYDDLIASGVMDATAVQALITTAVNGLLNGAPGQLNTLKELADALNDDANFAATVTAALAARLGLVQAAKNPDLLITGAITVDGNDLTTSAAVVWPDGSPGTLTITSRDSNNAVLAYNITYGSPVTKTFTQSAITRNANGAATNVPPIVVS